MKPVARLPAAPSLSALHEQQKEQAVRLVLRTGSCGAPTKYWWDTAVLTLEATGATIDIAPPFTWSWMSGRRPYAVTAGLWRLPVVRPCWSTRGTT